MRSARLHLLALGLPLGRHARGVIPDVRDDLLLLDQPAEKIGPFNRPCWAAAALAFYIVQRIAAAAWFQPSPELIMTTRSPRLTLRSSIASPSAMGMQAEPV